MTWLLSLAGGLLGGWKKWALVGLAVLAVAGYVLLLRAQVAEARLDAAQAQHRAALWEGAAETNRKALDRLRADTERAQAEMAATHRAALARLERRTRILQEIADAPETDDGPLAPVLSRALERLRQQGAGNSDQGRVREAGNPGRPVDLPRGSGGS